MVYLLKIHHALVRVCFDQKISWFCLSGIRIRPVLGPLAILSSPNSECSFHVWIPIYFNTVMRLQLLRRVAQWARMHPKCAKSHFPNFSFLTFSCKFIKADTFVYNVHISFSSEIYSIYENFPFKVEISFNILQKCEF